MKIFVTIATLLVAGASAFTATPPPILDQAVIASDSAELQAPFSSSNLPSHRQLLDQALSSSVLLSAASTKEVAATQIVNVVDIHYDGAVPTTESDEYVVIKNFSKAPVDISGYYMYVATTGTQGPTFTFPKGSVVKPGSMVRVYTNEIHKETGGYSFGSGKAIWNNRGGLAVFKDANGNKVRSI